MSNKMQDKVILITGAGRGLGRTLAEKLGAAGAILAVNDINPLRAEETVDSIIVAGGRAKAYPGDISRKFAVQAIAIDLEDEYGRIDVLINNARVLPEMLLLETDEWNFRRTIDVNLIGAFLMMQVVGRVMQAVGTHGAMVNILERVEPQKGLTAYRATYGALSALTETAAVELAEDGIRVGAFEIGEGDTIEEILDFLFL